MRSRIIDETSYRSNMPRWRDLRFRHGYPSSGPPALVSDTKCGGARRVPWRGDWALAPMDLEAWRHDSRSRRLGSVCSPLWRPGRYWALGGRQGPGGRYIEKQIRAGVCEKGSFPTMTMRWGRLARNSGPASAPKPGDFGTANSASSLRCEVEVGHPWLGPTTPLARTRRSAHTHESHRA